MRTLARAIPMPVLLAACSGLALGSKARAQSADSLGNDVDSKIVAAQQLIAGGEYGQAIELLSPVLDAIRPDKARLEQTYLLLIESYVYTANARGVTPVFRGLSMEKAEDLVRECLSNPEFRHTRPDSVRSPAEMAALFESVRSELFGTVWIRSVDPADAEVTLDGERLERGEDGTWLAEDVPQGLRTLTVRHPDRRPEVRELPVRAGERLVESVQLEHTRGVGWYATRVVLPAAAAGVLIAVLADDQPAPPEPLLDGSPPRP